MVAGGRPHNPEHASRWSGHFSLTYRDHQREGFPALSRELPWSEEHGLEKEGSLAAPCDYPSAAARPVSRSRSAERSEGNLDTRRPSEGHATSHFPFPLPLQHTGTGSRKSIGKRGRSAIKERAHAQSTLARIAVNRSRSGPHHDLDRFRWVISCE